MTQQDYKLIAESIGKSVNGLDDFNFSEQEGWAIAEALHHVVDNLMQVFSAQDKKFSRDKFLEQCQLMGQEEE